jgi:RimJ/RimL family protein N-acetyltransferase
MSPEILIPEVKLPSVRLPDLTCDDIFRLETKRLWLRWPRANDAAALTAISSLAQVAQMTAHIPHPYPPRAADRFILQTRAENAAGTALHLVIAQKTGARPVIGVISVSLTETDEAEIGYVVKPDVWGKGFATEAVHTVIDAAFNLTSVPRIHANCRVGNVASQRVLEKTGFSYVDSGLDLLPARGGLHRCDRFCLERADWRRYGSMASRLPPMMQQAAVAEASMVEPGVLGEFI